MYTKIFIPSVFVLILLTSGHSQDPAPAPGPALEPPGIPEWMKCMDLCDALNGGLGTPDFDGDGVGNCVDNCIFDPNGKQEDKDKNGVGDACEQRKRADDEWNAVGQKQRRTATEPVDLRRLAAESAYIVLATVHEGHVPDKIHPLGRWARITIIKQLKGERLPRHPTVDGGVWVHLPDGGPRELVGPLLFFLNKGRLRDWGKPQVYGIEIGADKPYIETSYVGHELANRKYGVLGVSDERLRLLEEIVRRKAAKGP